MTKIYTDGACAGNPGKGGWAAIVKADDCSAVEYTGSAARTTNNAMELMAVVAGLSESTGPAEVYSDSQYVVLGITRWISGWRRRGWRTKEHTPVKNLDLWQEIDALTQGRVITWNWVKGHNGHPENERCDRLATAECQSASWHHGRAGRIFDESQLQGAERRLSRFGAGALVRNPDPTSRLVKRPA